MYDGVDPERKIKKMQEKVNEIKRCESKINKLKDGSFWIEIDAGDNEVEDDGESFRNSSIIR